MHVIGNHRLWLVGSAVVALAVLSESPAAMGRHAITPVGAAPLSDTLSSNQKADEKKPAAPPLRLPFGLLKPDAVLDLAGVGALAVIDDAVWVTNRAAGTAIRIDPKTNKVAQTIAVGQAPCGAPVGGFGSLWVSLCGLPGVARVDLTTNAVTATIKTSVGGESQSMAIGVGSLWLLTDAKGTLARFDPATNAAVAEAYLAAGSNALVFGQGALWATSAAGNLLTRLNPNTNVIVETITVGKAPRAVAVGEGAVWTLNQGDGTVSRVDPKTNKTTDVITLGPMGAEGEIIAGEGSVWVSAAGTPLIRIDPRTKLVVQQFTGPGGGAVVVGQGSLWIAASATAVWRIDPKRVEATRPQ
jgi:virginiamycin B lyase